MIEAIVLIGLIAFVTVPRATGGVPVRSSAVRGFTLRRRRVKRRQVDPGALMTEVATRLRSGVSASVAWEKTLREAGFEGTDLVLDVDGVPGALHRLRRAGLWERRKLGLTKVSMAAIPAVVVACRLGQTSGAPLADVLDECAEGIIESGEAVSARDVAMAGPETSAYMLAYLPLVGLGFGYLIGADPIAFFTGSLMGKVVLVVGVGIELAGVVWTRKLIATAKQEDDE